MEIDELPTTTQKKFVSNKRKYENELNKLEAKYNGRLTPQDIVREASKDKSPLHNWFDWNDDSAGEKYRLWQARILINTIKVRIDFEGGTKEYKKYVNVTLSNGTKNHRAYVTTDFAISDEKLREQILKKAINEAEYWQRAYNDYQELEDIFKGITKTKRKLKKILVDA